MVTIDLYLAGKRGYKMIVGYPDYYKDFRCSAGDCPDTCCGGWKISIDNKTWKKYKGQKGELGRKMRGSLDKKERCFVLKNGFCPFLNEDRLCSIQMQMGERYLCRTCRDYPRHMEVYDGLKEVSLSLSCPEAAKIILKREPHFSVAIKRTEGNERPGRLLRILYQARRGMFRIMEDDSLSLENRLAMILAVAHDIQIRLDRRRREDILELLTRCSRPEAKKELEAKSEPFRTREEERRQYMAALMEVTKGLENITASWPVRRERCIRFLENKKIYKGVHEKFLYYKEKNRYLYVNLMIYFLYVYFLGAVYDQKVYGKVKLAVVSCLAVQEMAEAVLAEKGFLEEKDIIREAYIYSREIEHSDTNLEGMEEILTDSPLFSMENLFVCIFS